MTEVHIRSVKVPSGEIFYFTQDHEIELKNLNFAFSAMPLSHRRDVIIHSFIYSFIRSFVRWFVHLFIRSFILWATTIDSDNRITKYD